MNYRSFLYLFLILALAFNGTLAKLVTAQEVHNLNSQFTSQAIVICTGKGFAWYSEAAFLETGQLIKIEPPEAHSDAQEHPTGCTMANFADQSFDHILPTTSLASLAVLFERVAVARYIRLSVDKVFTPQLQRGPPAQLS